MDHVLPQSAGGSDWMGNLVLSCRSCNMRRLSTPAAEWTRNCLAEGMKVRETAVYDAIARLRDPRCFRLTYRIIKAAERVEMVYEAAQRRQERQAKHQARMEQQATRKAERLAQRELRRRASGALSIQQPLAV